MDQRSGEQPLTPEELGEILRKGKQWGFGLSFRPPFVLRKRPYDFRLLNLKGADFRTLDLSGARFRGANLASANFDETKLVKCDFRDTEISNASFEEADLTEANFSRADIKSAIGFFEPSNILGISPPLPV